MRSRCHWTGDQTTTNRKSTSFGGRNQLVNDLTDDCGPSAPGYNVVGAPVAGSIGVVADDVELVEPGVPESVNESTWS